MAKICARDTIGYEFALLRCAVSPMAPLSTVKTAVRRHVEATATAAATSAAAPLDSTCTITEISGAVAVTSCTVTVSTASMALSAPASAAATSSRTATAAAFAGDECMLGLSGRLLCPLLLGQVGVTRAYHADDFVPISVLHGLQSFFDEGILVGQRAYKTCVQHCLRNPTDPLLIHLVGYILEIMKCGNGATVGWNYKLVELVVQSLGRHLTLWVMPLFETLKNLPWRSASF